MSFFGKIGHFFAVVGKSVGHAFVVLFGSEAAHAFAAGAKALLQTALGKLALDAVDAVESLSPTAGNAEKRAAAFAKLVGDAKGQGLNISDSIANMLIEVAVNALKGHLNE